MPNKQQIYILISEEKYRKILGWLKSLTKHKLEDREDYLSSGWDGCRSTNTRKRWSCCYSQNEDDTDYHVIICTTHREILDLIIMKFLEQGELINDYGY